MISPTIPNLEIFQKNKSYNSESGNYDKSHNSEYFFQKSHNSESEAEAEAAVVVAEAVVVAAAVQAAATVVQAAAVAVKFIALTLHIMLRDLLTQKCSQKKTVTDFGYPRACRFRKYQKINRS
jgi:hypothetical protein